MEIQTECLGLSTADTEELAVLGGLPGLVKTLAIEAPSLYCRALDLAPELSDERCTDSGKGRVVSRAFDEDYRELARQRQTTEAYQKALRKRQVWVEPLFGEAKDWHQLRQFRLRGLANVNMYGLLVAAGQNLKRYLAVVRRGHRPAEGQRAVAVLPCLCPLR